MKIITCKYFQEKYRVMITFGTPVNRLNTLSKYILNPESYFNLYYSVNIPDQKISANTVSRIG